MRFELLEHAAYGQCCMKLPGQNQAHGPRLACYNITCLHMGQYFAHFMLPSSTPMKNNTKRSCVTESQVYSTQELSTQLVSATR